MGEGRCDVKATETVVKTYALELDAEEAAFLKCLLGRGLSWFASGKFGDKLGALYNLMDDKWTVEEADYLPYMPGTEERINWLPEWKEVKK